MRSFLALHKRINSTIRVRIVKTYEITSPWLQIGTATISARCLLLPVFSSVRPPTKSSRWLAYGIPLSLEQFLDFYYSL